MRLPSHELPCISVTQAILSVAISIADFMYSVTELRCAQQLAIPAYQAEAAEVFELLCNKPAQAV